MPPNPSSSGASAQYTVVAAPCCCGRKETQRQSGVQREIQDSSASIQTARARQRRHRKGQKWTDTGGWVMLSWEKKPKLYIYSIYIHIFIYLFLSLPSVYSYSHVGSHKCNRPTAAKGGKRQKLKKKNRKTSHQLQSGLGKPQLMCLYCKSDRFYCHGDEYENAHRMYLCVAVCLKYRK